MSIEVQDLTKVYGTQRAIDAINFKVNTGEILGLLGPNGAGKTTTMKILTCFIPPSSGVASVCGYPVQTNSLDIRRKVGYLPEHNPLYNHMYVKEYLTFIARIHKLDKIKNRVDELVEQVGLTQERHKLIQSLSKGYKQRVGLAQALIHDPEVLILDEPISGLDPNQLVEIRSLIKGLKKDKTIIFSSHILQEVEEICDHILILDKGKVVTQNQLGVLKSQSHESLQLKLQVKEKLSSTKLQKLKGVKRVESLNELTFLIQAEADIREDIFDIVVESQNKILNLSIEDESLENIFKSLTKKNN